jgi:hypothetical protein
MDDIDRNILVQALLELTKEIKELRQELKGKIGKKPKEETDFDKALKQCTDFTAEALGAVKYDPVTNAPIFPEEAPKKPYDPSKPISLDNRIDLNTHFDGALAQIATQEEIEKVITEAIAQSRKTWPVREDRTATFEDDYTGTYKVTPDQNVPPLDIAKIMEQK